MLSSKILSWTPYIVWVVWKPFIASISLISDVLAMVSYHLASDWLKTEKVFRLTVVATTSGEEVALA